MNEFYVYIYFDTRKEGTYKYLNYTFKFEPFYIGKGKESRMVSHLRRTKNSHIKNKINKIILETSEVPLILKFKDNLSEIEALELEINLIKSIGRYDLKLGPLTNKTNGGDGVSGYKHTDETKKILSERIFTDEHRSRMSKSNKGRKVWNSGLTGVQEAWNKGMKGEGTPNFGKLGKNHWLSKPIIQFTKENEFVKEWECSKQIYRDIKFNDKNILKCCHNKRKSAHGYFWEFKNK